MTPLEFVDEYYRRAKLERQIEAVDIELPLHMYLKVHKDEVAYCEEYSLLTWGLANGTSRIIPKENATSNTTDHDKIEMKQKEIDFLAALDEIEQEMEQEKAARKYRSSLRTIEKQLTGGVKL